VVILTEVHAKKNMQCIVGTQSKPSLTIKHLKITVGEYTYGLPRFFGVGVLGHGIQPIRYRMLKRMDSFNLLRANLWNSCSQNNIPKVSFKLL
jgi:hypothetical protein